jgi:hypothetical protein
VSAEGEVERAAAKAGEHVIAKAVEQAGVREAEELAPKVVEEAAVHAAAKGESSALSVADREALREYTGPAYKEINAYNRGVPMSPEQAAHLEERSAAISRALDKLPPHEGTVYRGGTFSDDLLARYPPGETLTEDAFTSTSRTRGFKGNTQFEVVSSNGKYVAPYAEPRFQHQEEVLFDRGTRFRVLAHDVKDGKHFIVLREVG